MNQRISQNKQQGSMNETGGTVSAGQWYTIVAWHNAVGNTLNIQVNNGTVNTVSYSGGAMDTTFPLVIGAHADGTFGLDGRIDELALYKRVLTPSERAWFHNGNGSGRAYVDLTAPVPTTTTTLAYDNAGRKTSMVDPDMGTWSYSYDALSNLKTQTDARGCTTSLNYDSLNRLTQKSYSNCPTTPTVNYYYDGQAFTFNGTNYNAYTNALGRRTGMMVAGSNANVWNYDTRGRLLSETVNAGTPYTTNLTYNSADMPLTMQYPDGEVVRNTYDARMLLDKVDNTSGATYVNNLDYDSAGRLTVLALNNGLTQNYTYYAWDEKATLDGQQVGQGGRLKTSTAGTLQNMSYLYDADGNIRSINNSITNPAEVQSFGYDVLDRLVSASAVNGPAPYSETYGYDSATGNLASKGSSSNSYTYNAQVTCAAGTRTIPHAVSAAFGNAYEYDCNGNQKKRVISGGQTLALEYDAENRLVKVCQDTSNNAVCDAGETVKVSFVYDGDGRRMKSVMGSETILFVGGHYEIKNPGSGQEVTKYYFAGAQRVAVRKYIIPQSTTLTYLLGDHLGSTSLAVDASTGAVIETRYKPWGEVRYTTPNKTLPTRYTFTGQYSYVADEATDLGSAGFGLMFYNARWYDPYLTHFTQPDTIVPDLSNPQDWDRYSYVRNNPVRYNDPSGHRSCDYEDDNGNCQTYTTSENINFYRQAIKNRFNWNVKGNNWTLKDLETIFQTGLDIESYVDSLTNGKGNAWINAYLGGTNITQWSNKGAQTLPSWLVGTNTIYLESGGFNGQLFAHELAHVWDINTSPHGGCACGVVDGVADQLNDAIGGNAFLRDLHFRWMNDRDNVANFTIPKTVTYGGFEHDNWFTKNSGYGNNGTADYLAESFSWNIYDRNSVPVVASVWVDLAITAQGNALP